MRIFVSIIFCLLFFTIIVPAAFAHAGPGPPFLEVDDEYAQTNVYFSGSSDINVPQDLISQKHLVNKPINFNVDTSKLLVPPDIAKASTFRWTFDDGSKQALGQTVVHTFTKPKTYLVTLEVKAPDQPDFLIIDTVQINVLPSISYQIPKPVISVATDAMQTTSPIIFESSASTVDPSTTIKQVQWDFGDGTDASGATVEHTYSNFDNYVSYPALLRVIDANGFYSDTGIIVDSEKGKLVFVDKNNKKNTIAIRQTLTANTSTTKSGTLPYGVISVGIVVFVVAVVGMAVTRKKK